MRRIINVKPQVVTASQMKRQFAEGHMAKRRMIMNKNHGVFVDDLIDWKQRYRDAALRPFKQHPGALHTIPGLPALSVE